MRSLLRAGTSNAVTRTVPTYICTTCASVVMPDSAADDWTCNNCVAVLPSRRGGGSLPNLLQSA